MKTKGSGRVRTTTNNGNQNTSHRGNWNENGFQPTEKLNNKNRQPIKIQRTISQQHATTPLQKLLLQQPTGKFLDQTSHTIESDTVFFQQRTLH